MVVVVVVAVATTSTTTIVIASTTTPLDHDWRSLMVHRLSKQNLATSAASLPDSVWQRVASSNFCTASNTVQEEDARGQQASKLHVDQNSFDPANLCNKRQAKVVQLC